MPPGRTTEGEAAARGTRSSTLQQGARNPAREALSRPRGPTSGYTPRGPVLSVEREVERHAIVANVSGKPSVSKGPAPSVPVKPGDFAGDPAFFGATEPDPELTALPAPPKRERTFAVVMMCLTAAAALTMALLRSHKKNGSSNNR